MGRYYAVGAAIVAICLPIILFLWRITTDIALIKQNHLTHIESIEKNIESLQREQNKLEQRFYDSRQDNQELQKTLLEVLKGK